MSQVGLNCAETYPTCLLLSLGIVEKERLVVFEVKRADFMPNNEGVVMVSNVASP